MTYLQKIPRQWIRGPTYIPVDKVDEEFQYYGCQFILLFLTIVI